MTSAGGGFDGVDRAGDGGRGDPDVVVVGGGPAGLTVAIACADRGFEVIVFDRRRTPIDKACGEGLMPDAVDVIQRLGVKLPVHRAIKGIRYLDDRSRAEGRFPRVPALGIRRTELHAALLARARDRGIEVVQRCKVGGVRRVRTDDRGPVWEVDAGETRLRPRWVVAADGLHSPIRRAVGLSAELSPRAGRRFGIRRHFRVQPWTDFVEVYWGPAGEAYVTPVADDEVGIAILWTRNRERSAGRIRRAGRQQVATGAGPDGREADVFARGLGGFPELSERVAGAEPTSTPMAAGPLRQRTRGVISGNLALLGDASGYIDAITGEGMALAVHQAEAFADAAVNGDLGLYASAHRRMRRVPDLLTEVTLQLAAHPALRRRSLTALAAEPELFDRILAVHTREAGPSALASAPLFGAARHFLFS